MGRCRDRGRKDRLSRSLPPPNRAGGFPAHGSPVGGFTSVRIDAEERGLRSWNTTPTLERTHWASAQLPPFTPSSRAVNIRSVQTVGSVHAHRARTSPSRIVLADTASGWSSVCLFVTISPFLSPFAPPPLQRLPRYYGDSDSSPRTALRLAEHELRPDPRRGLPASRTWPSSRSVATHPMTPASRFHTLPLSGGHFPSLTAQGLGFVFGSQTRRVIWPYRVRSPTDRVFTSHCFGPHLTVTPLCSVTGRRAHAWRGLSPRCPCPLAGALARRLIAGVLSSLFSDDRSRTGVDGLPGNLSAPR